MSTIHNNTVRVGKFTSSGISSVMKVNRKGDGFGTPALTYIQEKAIERMLTRGLGKESSARPLSWGKLVESRVFDLLGIEYKISSQETIQHTKHKFWCGSPDGEKFEGERTVVFDIKCPITLKSFFQLIEPRLFGLDGTDAINYIRENHDSGEAYYWQLVSNACLTYSDHAELIVYCPYKNELDTIRELASLYEGDDQYIYKWIAFSHDDELPYIPEESRVKNIYTIRFKIPQADKELLEKKIIEAEELVCEKIKQYEAAH